MPQSLGRRILVSLLVGVAIAVLFVVPALLRGTHWQDLDPAWVHLLRAMSGAIMWFLMGLLETGLRSLGRRRT